jgi:lactoylglutathione lyase
MPGVIPGSFPRRIMKNDHTAFQVADLDAAIRFYTETLGLRLLSQSVDAEHQEAFAFLELEGGNLELLQKLGKTFTPRPIEPPYCPHLALETDDVDRMVANARQRRIHIIAGPFETPGEAKWVYMSDPDDNVIEFVEWLKKE